MDKQLIRERVRKLIPQMEQQAFAIFDRPECDGKEYFAAGLLADALEADGFAVERGIAGLETAFRAVWKHGEGGPNIGILAEYDALLGIGHACGHHMQGPAGIAAAAVIREAALEQDIPMTLTVYGTPAEETFGGKILMAQAGCFSELDVALGCHAGGKSAKVVGTSLAVAEYFVQFHGKSAHAAGSPEKGRSALDALLLTFNAIEFMREHVRPTSRMHYNIETGTGAPNAVPDSAASRIVLRSPSLTYLKEDMVPRFMDILKGAALMTGTTYDVEESPIFEPSMPNTVLNQMAIDLFPELGQTDFLPDPNGKAANGSTDFGNVTRIVPTGYYHTAYKDAPGHSQAWLDAGKTQAASDYMFSSASLLAMIAIELLEDPSKVAAARLDWEKRLAEETK